MAKQLVRLTEQDDTVIATLHKRGKSIKEIAEFMDCAESTVHKHLKDMGLIMVPKDEPKVESGISLDALVEVLKSIDGHLSAMEEALTIISLREDNADPLSSSSQR